MKFRALLFVAGALVVIGCGSDVDDRPAVWGYVSPAIVQPNCATSSCHSRGAAVAGLDLSTLDSGYNGLTKLTVTRPTGQMERRLVLPGNPAESRALHMLRAAKANRMPPDRPLAAADIELFEQWILLGAQKD